MVIGLINNLNIDDVNKQIQELVKKKKEVYLKEDKHEITSKEYEESIKEIDVKWRELNNIKIQYLQNKLIDKEVEIVENKNNILHKPLIKKVNEKIIENKLNKQIKVNEEIIKDNKIIIDKNDSYVNLILKALQHPKIDNEDKLIAIINYWKPGMHDNDIKRYFHLIIYGIRNKTQKKFKNYEWDEKNYMVKKICQTLL
jgi:hypothetical protein